MSNISIEVEVLPAVENDDPVFNPVDAAILKNNRDLKINLIKKLTPNGNLPADKDQTTALLALMSSLDSEVLTRARIRVAAKTENGVSDLRALVAQALLNKPVKKPQAFSPKAIEAPAGMKFAQPVPGAMDVGVVNLTLKDLEVNE